MRKLVSSALLSVLLIGSAAARDGKPINATCPVKGEPVKGNLTTTYKGQVIGFC
jgi:hypothetical protein